MFSKIITFRDEKHNYDDTLEEPPSHGEGPDWGDIIGDNYDVSDTPAVRSSSDLDLSKFCEANGIHDYAAVLRARHHRTFGRHRPVVRRAGHRARRTRRCSRRTSRSLAALGDGGDPDPDGDHGRSNATRARAGMGVRQ